MKTLNENKGLGTGSTLVENGEPKLASSFYHDMTGSSKMENAE